jgi:RND family efflux transporter MFP subunit
MKIVRRIIYWMVAIAVVSLTYWYVYGRKSSAVIEEKGNVPVEVATVGTESIERTVESTGWMKANQVVDVASKVAGRVESLQVISDDGISSPVEEGLVVRKGSRLAIIDHQVYLAQLTAAEANVKAAQVQLQDAQRERDRIAALYEGGSYTEQSRDKAITAAELAAAALNSAKANLELAKINLQESTIISPIDGVVTAKYIDEGNLIRIGDRLATVADIRIVRIIVALAEAQAQQVRVGTPVRIMVDALGQQEFKAAVYSIYPALDEHTHTIQVETRLDNRQMLLKPGMFARVTLITERVENAVVIPRDVILGGKIDRHYVYVVEDADTGKVARKRFVKIGITQGQKYQIAEGINAGQTLVVNGMNFLADGTGVEVVRLEDIR